MWTLDLARHLMVNLWEQAAAQNECNIREALEQVVRRGTHHPLLILDLGCGDGTYTRRLVRTVPTGTAKLLGMELIIEAADRAAANGLSTVVADLNQGLPFRDREIDIAISNQVIEHIQDLDRYVSELFRVIKTDGTVIISTENLSSWHNVLSLVLGFQPFSLTNISFRNGSGYSIGNPLSPHRRTRSRYPATFMHTRVLAPLGLIELFQEYGFRIDNIRGAGYYPLPYGIAGWMSSRDATHAAFITLIARRQGD
jgi:SAM-dependent methyltransferase